jgi:hypothetical protein
MTQESNTTVQAHVLQRFLVILIYITATVFLLTGLAYLLSSPPCFQDNNCSKYDQIYFAAAAMFDFVFAFFYFIVGFKGLLPGARKKQA